MMLLDVKWLLYKSIHNRLCILPIFYPLEECCCSAVVNQRTQLLQEVWVVNNLPEIQSKLQIY